MSAGHPFRRNSTIPSSTSHWLVSWTSLWQEYWINRWLESWIARAVELGNVILPGYRVLHVHDRAGVRLAAKDRVRLPGDTDRPRVAQIATTKAANISTVWIA